MWTQWTQKKMDKAHIPFYMYIRYNLYQKTKEIALIDNQIKERAETVTCS